jgi:hypothetical protein
LLLLLLLLLVVVVVVVVVPTLSCFDSLDGSRNIDAVSPQVRTNSSVGAASTCLRQRRSWEDKQPC